MRQEEEILPPSNLILNSIIVLGGRYDRNIDFDSAKIYFSPLYIKIILKKGDKTKLLITNQATIDYLDKSCFD